MTFFSPEDGENLQSGNVQTLYKQMQTLHDTLTINFKSRDYDLHPYRDEDDGVVQTASVSYLKDGKSLTLQYMRSVQQAMTIERLMGRDQVQSAHQIDARRHPVIEVRLTPEHFVIELVLSPDAWWDQQNLAGKLSIARHRKQIYEKLAPLDDAIMGYWEGTHQDEMHVEGIRFQYPRVLTEWLSTFAPGKDWFRLGMWYPLEGFSLTGDDIHDEVITQISRLHPVYTDILWRSDNNFREFHDNNV